MRKARRRRKKKTTTKPTTDMELNELRIRNTQMKSALISPCKTWESPSTLYWRMWRILKHDDGVLLGATLNLYWGPGWQYPQNAKYLYHYLKISTSQKYFTSAKSCMKTVYVIIILLILTLNINQSVKYCRIFVYTMCRCVIETGLIKS